MEEYCSSDVIVIIIELFAAGSNILFLFELIETIYLHKQNVNFNK